MPLRTLIEPKDSESESDTVEVWEEEYEKGDNHRMPSRTGIVSTIRKTMAKYSSSRSHSPVSSRPTVSCIIPKRKTIIYLILPCKNRHLSL